MVKYICNTKNLGHCYSTRDSLFKKMFSTFIVRYTEDDDEVRI